MDFILFPGQIVHVANILPEAGIDIARHVWTVNDRSLACVAELDARQSSMEMHVALSFRTFSLGGGLEHHLIDPFLEPFLVVRNIRFFRVIEPAKRMQILFANTE